MGNPNNHGGFYFVEYRNTGTHTIDRTKGSFRHYIHYLQSGSATYYTELGTFTPLYSAIMSAGARESHKNAVTKPLSST